MNTYTMTITLDEKVIKAMDNPRCHGGAVSSKIADRVAHVSALRNVSDMATIMDLGRVEFRAEKGIVTFGTHANDMALRSGETDNYFVEVGRVRKDVNYRVPVHANPVPCRPAGRLYRHCLDL